MQIVRGIQELGVALGKRERSDLLALVPTMGALHDGHLALIADGKRRAGRIAATIFVNPTQFNDPSDLERYPRTEEADLAKLKAAGCELVWLPTADQLYPQGFATTVSVRGVADRWEGEHRPGHFDGVATVVAKLLIATSPDLAIFGEKDWQQLAVIRRMATDLNLPVEIVGAETVRDADGLALSSRNIHLTEDERRRAVALPDTLRKAADLIRQGAPVADVLRTGREALAAANFSRIDYLALVNAATMEPLEQAEGGMRLIAAAVIGTTRLIDNVAV